MGLVVSRPTRHLRVAMVKRSQARCIPCIAAPSLSSTQPVIPTPPESWPHPSTSSAANSYGERRGKRWWAQPLQQERPSTMWTGVVDAIQVEIWLLPLLLRPRVRIQSLWWTRPDSNRRPTRCKRVALPTELQVQVQWLSGARCPSSQCLHTKLTARAASAGDFTASAGRATNHLRHGERRMSRGHRGRLSALGWRP